MSSDITLNNSLINSKSQLNNCSDFHCNLIELIQLDFEATGDDNTVSNLCWVQIHQSKHENHHRNFKSNCSFKFSSEYEHDRNNMNGKCNLNASEVQ